MTRNKIWIWFATALGGLSVLSGIYFLLLGGYVQGIVGIIIGAFLIFINLKKSKEISQK